MYLMFKDEEIMKFDLDSNEFVVLNDRLLPYSLRGRIVPVGDALSQSDHIKVTDQNRYAFINFLARRVLNINRENAKKILNAYHLPQDQTDYTKAQIAMACRALSMIDCYWIKESDEALLWDDVNLRTNHLNEVVTQIALKGSSFSITGRPHTPELTGHGAYAKAWVRKGKDTYLLKGGTDGNDEEKIEVSISRILDCFNVPHVQYTLDNFEGRSVCKSKNMATEDYSIVPAEDVILYCNKQGIDPLRYMMEIDAENIYKTCIVDYLCSNRDRHGENYGFYMDNVTGELVCCHPLFDHNNGFDKGDMHSPCGGDSLIFTGKDKREVASYAMKHCDFHCTAPVKREFFLTDEMYESFMQRAVELGLYQYQKPSIPQRMHLTPYEKYIPCAIEDDIEQTEPEIGNEEYDYDPADNQ